MLLLISPAKSLDFTPAEFSTHSMPRLLADSDALIKNLKQKTSADLQKLMKVSENIASLNVERFNGFSTPFSLDNSKQALLAFQGDVYKGMETDTFSEDDLAFAQQHLRILSGLYGLLKPLDLIQPYRLEMGTKLVNKKGKNLYEFWDTKITELVNEDLKAQGDNIVINLASVEYFKSVKPKNLKADLYNIEFKEDKNGQYKIVAFFAKKARGMMSNFIIKNRLTQPEELKAFDMDGYYFNSDLSSEKEFVFTR
jgi:cytoplasmic iron level regulating protein YaaA (DUF328/UPF0246 family)